MKAVRVDRTGSSTALSIEDVPKPSIKNGELLVKIRASFVQPADIMNSKGGFPITTFPRTIGKDFSGTVVEGPDEWKGKDVYGTSGGTFSFSEDGAQAEYAVLRETAVAEKPKNISFVQAAFVGTPFTTAFTALLRARPIPTDVVMVLGATGSVGSSVVQIAQSMGHKTVTVGRHGTDVNSVEDPELQKARDLTGGTGPNVVIDTVGDLALTKAAFDVLANNGRLSTIAAPKQGFTELSVDLRSLYRRQVEVIGVNTTSFTQEELAKLMKELVVNFESGKLTVPDESTMTKLSIDQAGDAYSGKAKRAVIVFDE